MTKEKLKRGNQIITAIEHQNERKKVLTKNNVKFFSIENRYQQLVKFSYKDVPERTKKLIDEIIDILIENADENIKNLNNELEQL